MSWSGKLRMRLGRVAPLRGVTEVVILSYGVRKYDDPKDPPHCSANGH